jgi:hypothetical protein
MGPTGPAGPGGIGGGGGGSSGTGPTGAVGPTGAGGQVAILSQKAAGTQTLVASTPTLITFATADASQSVGNTGLIYSAGLWTNNTSSTIPVLVEYAIFLNLTGQGSSYIAVNGPSNTYAVMYNDVNAFTNTYTILLPAGQTIGIYYMDNGTPTIQNSSRATMTILMAGQQGPTGAPAILATVTTLSVTPASQSITGGGSGQLIAWSTVDATQTQGVMGLTYSLPTGSFTNSTSYPLPLLIEYSLSLSTTGGGASYIGVTTGGTTTPYGSLMNDNNGVVNSFTVIVPAGSSVGIYYMDNVTTTLQSSSRMTITLLMAAQGNTGAVGPTGPMGQVAAWAMTPTTTQSIPATTITLVSWGTTDASQTTGISGLNYNAGLFTNTTTTTLTLLVEYSIFLNSTGQGTSSIGINGSTQTYGTMYNDNNCFTNSYTILLVPGSNMGVYYYDNNAVTVQTTSRLMVTQMIVGPQGPTGMALWQTTGANMYYNSGNVMVGTGTTGNLAVAGTINLMTVGQGAGGVASNTVMGTNALANNTTGANNMVIGYNAGYTPAGFTGSNNIYVGASAVPSSGSASNEIVIGQGATGAGSNTVTIGNSSTLSTTLSGNVRSFSYTVIITSTGYTQIIANATANNPLFATSGVWIVSANATSITNPAAGMALSSTAYVATNVSYPTYANVYGILSSINSLAITGGTNTGASTGYGIYLYVTAASAYGTYTVNFLRIN